MPADDTILSPLQVYIMTGNLTLGFSGCPPKMKAVPDKGSLGIAETILKAVLGVFKYRSGHISL